MGEITPQNRFFSSVKLQLFYEISDKLMKKFFERLLPIFNFKKVYYKQNIRQKLPFLLVSEYFFLPLYTYFLYQCSKIAIFKLFRYYWIDKCILQLQEI